MAASVVASMATLLTSQRWGYSRHAIWFLGPHSRGRWACTCTAHLSQYVFSFVYIYIYIIEAVAAFEDIHATSAHCTSITYFSEILRQPSHVAARKHVKTLYQVPLIAFRTGSSAATLVPSSLCQRLAPLSVKTPSAAKASPAVDFQLHVSGVELPARRFVLGPRLATSREVAHHTRQRVCHCIENSV